MIVNGQKQQHIAIADRAVQYGDGCFTTMAFRNGQIELFPAHIKRLKLACDKLAIAFTRWPELEEHIHDSLPVETESVIKVIITRGEGGRGYSPEGTINPSFIITHHNIPTHYALWQTQGIDLTVSPVNLAYQPLLAGIKHLNRLEQVLVKQALAKTSYHDAVVCDVLQNIVETSVGNLFWYLDGVWYTADLTGAGVEGVMRNLVVGVIQEKGLDCHTVRHHISTLFDAEEVFICNSLMKLVPVLSLFNPKDNSRKNYSMSQMKQLQHDVLCVIQS